MYNHLETNILVPSLVLLVYIYLVLLYTYVRDKHLRKAERVAIALPLAALLVWYKRHIRIFFTGLHPFQPDLFIMYFAVWGIYQWIFCFASMFMIMFSDCFFWPIFSMHSFLHIFILVCFVGILAVQQYAGVFVYVFMNYIF